MAILKIRERNAPPPEEKEQSVKQRSQYQRSGVNAKKTILGLQAGPNPGEEPKPTVKKQPGNFSSPTDFYAGPQEPGQILGGVRRFDDAEQDNVGYMLSEKFYESTDGCDTKKKNLGGHDNVDNKCFPLKPEPPLRSGVKPIKAHEEMDAPWFEDGNPQPPREGDEAAHAGKKVYPDHWANAHETTFIYPPQHAAPPSNGNRKNHSKDVTNLGQYTAKELNESEVHRWNFGPVKWTAPGMDYPKYKPVIKPINSRCTECHDVLGNGRFGEAPVEIRNGVANTEFHPKDQENLIPFPPPPPQQTRPAKPDKIFRYYDPARDDASKFKDDVKVSSVAHVPGKTQNGESASHWKPHGGKGRGLYSRNGQPSLEYLS